MVNKKQDVPRCKKCNSTLIYLRNNLTERVCRSCGNVEKLK